MLYQQFDFVSGQTWYVYIQWLVGLFVASGLLSRTTRFLRCHPNPAKPPSAPLGIPVLGHALLFLGSPTKLASIVTNAKGPPILRFRLPFTSLWLVRDTEHIRRVFLQPEAFDFVAVSVLFLKNVLEMPRSILDMICRDNSGVARKPSPGSNIPPNERFMYLKHEATNRVISRTGLPALIEHFEDNLQSWMNDCDIGTEWVEKPDLYLFLRDILFKVSVDAFFGPHLLRESPHLMKDFWQFDEDIPALSRGLPRFLNPGSRNARDKCIAAVKNWRGRAKAHQSDDNSDANWDEHWGLKCMKLRNKVFESFKEWDDQACAATDTAMFWATNTNIIPATFWFIYETLANQDLMSQARNEVALVKSDDPNRMFDTRRLLGSPLLQSIYAETLRMYVAVMMVRETMQDSQLGRTSVPQGQKVVVCSYTGHMDERNWNVGTEEDPHPVRQFWGKRFLQDSESGPIFSLAGTEGKWLPYGMGERMCPGRHFAKHQMMLTFAYITAHFDIDLGSSAKRSPAVDINHFGFGTLPPAEPIPFRLRKSSRV